MASSYEEIFKEENEKSYKDSFLLKRLWKYMSKYKLILFIAFFSLFVATIIDLAVPYVTKYGIDNVINIEQRYNIENGKYVRSDNGIYQLKNEDGRRFIINTETNEKIEISTETLKEITKSDINKLVYFSGFLLAILLIKMIISYLQVFYSNILGQKVIIDLRKELYEHVLNIKYSFFTKTPTGKITTRIVNDTQNLSDFFTDVLTSLTQDVAILIGVVILMFTLNVRLTMYSVIMFPIVIVAVYIFRIFDRKAYDKVRTRVSALNAYLSENISGSMVTKLFNKEDKKDSDFNNYSTRLYKAKILQMYVYAIFRPLLNLMYYLALSLLLWFGSKGIRENFITFGTLYAFTTYIDMFFKPLFDIAEKYDIMQNALASASKIFKLLEEKTEYKGKNIYQTFENGKIEFKNVWFSYNDDEEYVLKDLNMTVNSGERISIVGETGSGKTTITKLVSGLYNHQKGNVYIDDKDLYDYNIENVRKKIAFVPQDVFLFSGNIYDNIRLFNEEISDEEVIKAAKKVYADDIISKFPEGYNTEILERATTLSSGEKQLIALTRAALFDSRIIILDEATANIDVETEYLIQKALNELSKEKTIISIAHRLSTVKSSSRILVIHKGKIVESGTHNELIDKKGVYFDLYKLQFEN